MAAERARTPSRSRRHGCGRRNPSGLSAGTRPRKVRSPQPAAAPAAQHVTPPPGYVAYGGGSPAAGRLQAGRWVEQVARRSARRHGRRPGRARAGAVHVAELAATTSRRRSVPPSTTSSPPTSSSACWSALSASPSSWSCASGRGDGQEHRAARSSAAEVRAQRDYRDEHPRRLHARHPAVPHVARILGGSDPEIAPGDPGWHAASSRRSWSCTSRSPWSALLLVG